MRLPDGPNAFRAADEHSHPNPSNNVDNDLIHCQIVSEARPETKASTAALKTPLLVNPGEQLLAP